MGIVVIVVFRSEAVSGVERAPRRERHQLSRERRSTSISGGSVNAFHGLNLDLCAPSLRVSARDYSMIMAVTASVTEYPKAHMTPRV